jgi:eukaryotic-like serine/threonine-protein kinase
MIGKTLGHCQITEKLGGGGMGVVYKARDARLGRTAALNHPHSHTLRDVGREIETDFLVIEFLDGQMLAARLTKDVLPCAWALEYAVQITQALAPGSAARAPSTAASSPAT